MSPWGEVDLLTAFKELQSDGSQSLNADALDPATIVRPFDVFGGAGAMQDSLPKSFSPFKSIPSLNRYK